MKPLKRLVIASLLVGLTLMTGESVWAAAGTQVPDPGDLFGANPNAKGKRVKGSLSIFYTFSSEATDCDNFGGTVVDMHVAMVAKRGNSETLRTEGEIFRGKCYLDISSQRTAVVALIEAQLLPKLFPQGFTSFEVKDVDNLVQDEEGDGSDENPFFMLLDFVLAVKAPGGGGDR